MPKHTHTTRRAALPIALAALLAALTAGGVASAATPKLGVRAAKLTKTNATTWTGAVLSPQLGKGRVTLIGNITFRDKDVDDPDADHHTFRFRATFKGGFLKGCFENDMRLRPGNRQVWDGLGRVTGTSKSLRRYRGMPLGQGGATPADDLTYAKPWSFGDLGRRPPGKPRC